MKNKPHTYSLFQFYIVTLFVLTTVCYAIIFIHQNTQRKSASLGLFNDTYYTLSNHLENSHLDFEELLITHIDHKNISYRAMIVTPAGQPFIHDNQRADQSNPLFFTFPYWNPDETQPKAHKIDHSQLLGWAALPDNYKLYIQVIHQPLSINWSYPLYWLPLLLALILLVIGFYFTMSRQMAWTSLIKYSTKFSNNLDEPYFPLRSKEVFIGQEFQRLANNLNRINQQLHHHHRLNQTLNNRLNRVVDCAPLPIFLVTRNGVISYFNRPFEQSFMTSFQEDMTYHLTDFLVGANPETHQLLTKIGKLRIPQALHVVSLEDDTDYLLHLQPWTGRQGQIQGFNALLTNVSVLTDNLKDADQQVQHQKDKLSEFDMLCAIFNTEIRTPVNDMTTLLKGIDTKNFTDEQLRSYTKLQHANQKVVAALNALPDKEKLGL